MMFERAGKKSQRGVITIFISMMMLLLITVMILTAYTMSTTNLRAVGNVQAREEAVAAANYVIEQVVESDFTAEGNDPNDAALVDFPVYIDDNSAAPQYEYLVDLDAPRCVRAWDAAIDAVSSVTLPGMSAGDAYHTIWELDATATEVRSGASVNVVQGIRILMDSVRKEQICP